MSGRVLRDHFAWPLSIDAVWLMSPLFLVAVVALLSPVLPNDYFWSLVQGRACVQLGAIPTENSFLFTLPAEAPFFDQPWLAQLAMYGAHTLGGHSLNVLLLALCLALGLGLAIDAALRLGADARALALIALFSVPVFGFGAVVRTQMFAYPCFSAVLGSASVRDDRIDPKRALVSAGVAALWANVHGSFVLAPLLMAAPLAVSLFKTLTAREPASDLRARSLGFLAVTAGTFVNPSGPLVYLYVVRLGRAMNVAGKTGVIEWQAPRVSSSAGALFFVLLGVSVAALLRFRRRSVPEVTWSFVALGLLSLSSQRFEAWWALAAPVALGPLFPARAKASHVPRAASIANAALIATFAAVLLMSLPGLPLFERVAAVGHLPYPEARVLGTQTPLRLGELLLRSGYRGRLFHDQALGGFVEWMLARDAPRPVAFVDQRFELTPAELWRDYFRLAEARGDFRALLRRYDIDAVLVNDGTSAALVDALTRDPRWLLRARELRYSLFVLKR
jgi:hypothetical protein